MKLFRGYVAPEWRTVLLRDPCVYCGAPAESLDHIRAAADNGPDGWPNRAPACHRCNGSKGCTPLLLFLLERLHPTYRPLPLPRRFRDEAPPPLPLRVPLAEYFVA